MVRNGLSAIALLAMTAAGAAGWSQPVQAQVSQATSFDIPAGTLGAALGELGREGRVLIAFDPALVQGLRTGGLQGQYSVAKALGLLLKGTPLQARPDGSGGYRLARKPAPPPRRNTLSQRSARSVQAEASPAEAQVAEIVVTGLRAVTAAKTDTLLIETPQSISVIDGKQFRDRGALNLQETLRYSSSVRPEPNGIDNRFDYSTARGGFSLAEYLDGLQRPSGFYAPRVDVFTVERVELLRGPSSVLYGQGSPGGLVNAISKLPDFATRGEIGIQYGSFDRKQAQVDITGGLDASGTLAARFVGLVRDAGNQVDYGRDDRWLVMPSLRWSPTEATDINLVYLHHEDRQRSISQFLPIQATLLAEPGRRMRDDTFLGEPDNNRFDKTIDSVSFLLSQRIATGIEFRSNTRWLKSRQDDEQVYPNVYSGAENPFLDEDRRQLSRSLFNTFYRLNKIATDNAIVASFETGPISHRVLAGVDYQRDRVTGGYAAADLDPIDIYAPVYTGVPAFSYESIGRQLTSQLGFYLQDQMRYADVATLMVGVRRDRARTATTGSPDQIDKVTSFRAGLSVQVSPGFAPYVNYAESFQPIVGVNIVGDPFKPERGRQYEAGIKWQPLSNSLVTVSVFDVRGTNRLVNDPADPNNLLQIGEVKSRGFEFEAELKLPQDWEVNASFSHVNAEVSRSTEPLEVGQPIIGVPRNLAALWLVKGVALNDEAILRLGGGVRYTGPSTQVIVAAPDILRQRTPSYTLFDGLVSLEWRQWTLSINATNLFDKRYYALCGYYADCAVGQRQNVIATLGWRF